ncbi:hypothetical protein HMPREF0262_02284 [Clostridium sp. ATCC 29733]|nr:hypothetical protein HMPREF0262_02284 [Clostridium sp. ATCC 29733]
MTAEQQSGGAIHLPPAKMAGEKPPLHPGLVGHVHPLQPVPDSDLVEQGGSGHGPSIFAEGAPGKEEALSKQ